MNEQQAASSGTKAEDLKQLLAQLGRASFEMCILLCTRVDRR